jgi:ABC-2 type transport system permease protein
MRLLPAGSIPWLLLHEMRLTWRGRIAGARKGRRAGWILLAVLFLALSIPGWLLAPVLREVHATVAPQAALGVDVALAVLFTLMTAATVAATATAFYERGDLDLLLSSPIPPRRVLTVRCVGIALQSALLWVLLITPFVVPPLIQGDPRWAHAYPVLLGLGLLASSVGLLVAMALFRLIGPRRTRAAATVVSALIGVSFALLGQMRGFFGRDVYGEIWDRLQPGVEAGWFDQGQPLAWPAQALIGDTGAAAALFGGSLLVFILVTQSIGARFGKDAAAAAGAGSPTKVAKGAIKGFSSGLFGVVVAKELRLIRRDATLLSQTLIQVLYLGVIMAALVFRNASTGGMWITAGGASVLVLLASQLASVFGWIVMSAEDAPELLAAAPAPTRTLRQGKLVAAMIPTAMIMAAPIAALTWLNWRAGLSALVCSAAVSWSAGLIALWFEKPAKRSELRRRRNGSITAMVVASITTICWSGAAFLGAMPGLWALTGLVPAVLGVVIVGAVAKPERSFADRLALAS